MPVKKGTTGISAVYKGTTSIGKIYKGTTLVFSSETYPSGFIKPRIVYGNENTNIYYTFNNDIQYIGIPNDNTDKNGFIDKSTVNNDTILYIPSYNDNKVVRGIYTSALANSFSIYPNIISILLGEGIRSLRGNSLRYDSSDSNNTKPTNYPKLVLPSSLESLYGTNVFSYINLYKVKTSDYNYYILGSMPTVSIFSGSKIDECIADSTILENDNTYILNSAKIKKLDIKNISYIGINNFRAIEVSDMLVIHNSVSNIGKNAFYDIKNTPNIRFNHLINDTISFTLDESKGPFYSKTNRTINIYTDNDTIKNHDWSGVENITATLYHLDGTAWS